jgi:hypothetical protein
MNVDPQTIRPTKVEAPAVYLPKQEYSRLMMRNRVKPMDYDRKWKKVNLSKLAAAKSTSKKQRKYFNMIQNYQTSLQKDAFERGFFKAALYSGADPMLAYQMYKQGAEQPQDPAQASMAPPSPMPTPAPTPAPPMGQAGGGQMDSTQHSANIAQLLAIIQKLLEQQKATQAPQSGLGLESLMSGGGDMGGGMPGSMGDSPDMGAMGGGDAPAPSAPPKSSKGPSSSKKFPSK